MWHRYKSSIPSIDGTCLLFKVVLPVGDLGEIALTMKCDVYLNGSSNSRFREPLFLCFKTDI
eukprot:scaffold16085_cov127-Skeletonema_marinoi.AAC.4